MSWTLAALLAFAPVASHDGRPWADDSHAHAHARYVGIAEAIDAACEDATAPRSCRALLVAIAIGESGLARDADEGPCYREGAWRSRCDGGRAASVWQVHRHCASWDRERGTCAAWTEVTDLFASRETAAKAALRQARWSLARCKDLSGLSGACVEGTRHARSAAARERLWRRIAAWEPR